MNIKITKRFLEFYGALMGDGCLSQVFASDKHIYHWTIITGHKFLDRDYLENYFLPWIKKEFGIIFRIIYVKNENTMHIRTTNKKLFFSLSKLGFPIGKKGYRLCIPKQFYKLKWSSVKYVIRGLFDTDGCITARKGEGYRYPYILITSKSIILIQQLYTLLRNQGYPVWMRRSKAEIGLRGIDNTLRWMQDVGSSNQRHISKYQKWLKTGVLPVNSKGK